MTLSDLYHMTPAQRLGVAQGAIAAQDWDTMVKINAILKAELQGVASQSQHRRYPVSRDAREAAPLKHTGAWKK